MVRQEGGESKMTRLMEGIRDWAPCAIGVLIVFVMALFLLPLSAWADDDDACGYAYLEPATPSLSPKPPAKIQTFISTLVPFGPVGTIIRTSISCRQQLRGNNGRWFRLESRGMCVRLARRTGSADAGICEKSTLQVSTHRTSPRCGKCSRIVVASRV